MHHFKNKILLIDDDPDFLSIYADALEKEGFKVGVACNGASGLKSALEDKPDLIISDVMMDTLDEGFELVHKLRALRQFEYTPIIMLTSVNKKMDFNWQFGANEYWLSVSEFLDKYVSPEELAVHAKRYLH